MLFKLQDKAYQKRFNNLIRIFLIISTGYILSSPFAPYPLSPVFKVLPIIVLGVLAWPLMSGKIRLLTLLALLFSGFGDLFLALQFESHFIFGLGSFLIAHLFYATLFFHFRCGDKRRIKTILIAVVGIFGITIFQIVMPHTGDLFAAVTFYMCVIMVTCCLAITTWKKGYWFAVVGALIFVISDTIIALNMFVSPLYLSDVWIMTTYYLAQLLIVCGLLRLSTKLEIKA